MFSCSAGLSRYAFRLTSSLFPGKFFILVEILSCGRLVSYPIGSFNLGCRTKIEEKMVIRNEISNLVEL